MLISQGFNTETGDLATFVENCERSESTDNIAMAKFSASDEDSDTKRKKKSSKFKEREKNGKKSHKKSSSIYWFLHGENKIHTYRECKVLKARDKDEDNPKYATKDHRRKSREVNLSEIEAAHKRSKYLKYKKIKKSFANKNTPKEDDTSDSNSSSSSEAYNSRDENEKSSITYDSESAENYESSNISISSEGKFWLNGCRYGFITDKVKPNIK